MINVRKAAIIGCGFVGSSIAFSLMQRGLYSELVLIDANQAKAEGEAMDLSHGLPYAASMQIYAGTYDDVADCAMVILTAGANQKPGETRLDLIDKNVAILKSIIPELTKRLFQGILLVVSNPVDVLTYAAWKLSGLPARHVIGSGTVLDTARLKYLLGQYLGVDSRNVHAAIIGEHGDSELAVWSSANISSLDLDHFCQLRGKKNYRAELDRIYHEVRDSAYEIIERKGATYYGIAMAVARIAECIVKNESAMLPISAVLEGEYGLENLCLSIPAIVGQDGVETVLGDPPGPPGEVRPPLLRRAAPGGHRASGALVSKQTVPRTAPGDCFRYLGRTTPASGPVRGMYQFPISTATARSRSRGSVNSQLPRTHSSPGVIIPDRLRNSQSGCRPHRSPRRARCPRSRLRSSRSSTAPKGLMANVVG